MNGSRIKVLLQQQKKSASQLARFCNVSAQGALNWINEEKPCQPREKHLDAIAEFFGISRQHLEYGALLCISTPQIPSSNVGNLNLKMSISTAEILISKELDGIQKSHEFISGMTDKIVHKLSGVSKPCSFRIGTCQHDAYMAGASHAERIISNI